MKKGSWVVGEGISYWDHTGMMTMKEVMPTHIRQLLQRQMRAETKVGHGKVSADGAQSKTSKPNVIIVSWLFFPPTVELFLRKVKVLPGEPRY